MALTVYDEVKIAFQETLDRGAVPITFNGITKPCMSSGLTNNLRWETTGFVPKILATVQMMDDDFEEFFGIDDSDATVILDNEIFTVEEIKTHSGDPVVSLSLTVTK
jgi:hypothetical protein